MLISNEKNKHIEENFSDLVKEAEKGNSFLVATFLSSNNFSKKSIDEAFRRCIRNYSRNKDDQEEYLNSCKAFIEHTEDFNFQNEEEDNQTILMEACRLGLSFIFDLIMKRLNDPDNSDLPRLDLNIVDNNEENVLHKLILSPNYKNEEERLDLFLKFVDMGVQIEKANKLGYTPLALAMITGNSTLSQELIKLNANKNAIVSSTGDSILHCAVLGKNPLCVSLLVNNTDQNLELKKAVNKKGESAVDLAAAMGLNKLIQLIGEEPNSQNINLISFLQPFEDFRGGNYEDALKSLFRFIETQKRNAPIEWNILITEYVMHLEELNRVGEAKQTDISLTSETTLSKMQAFFQNLETQKCFGLLLYNAAIFYYKQMDYKKVLSLLEDKGFQKPIYNQTEWIIYANISLILLEIFLSLRQMKLVNIVLENLEEFFNTALKNKQKETVKENISEYLNSKEILNQELSMDDSFCVLSLYKSYKSLLENKLDDSKKQLKEFKRVSNSCKYKDQLPIFNTMKNFYHYLKIKTDYFNNSFFKCYKHLNSFYTNTIAKSNSIELQVFYLNTLGIINLRQKKYTLAQCFFKSCLALLRKANVLVTKFQPELNKHQVSVKFNIGLCHFYEKNYEKAYRVFTALASNMECNPFLHYRMGLCCVEQELGALKNESTNSYNEFIDKLIGYKETPNQVMSPRSREEGGAGGAMQTNGDGDSILNSLLGNNAISNNYPVVNTYNSQNMKRIIMRYNSAYDDLFAKEKSKFLNDAVDHFKQTILILKDNVYYKKEVGDVLTFLNANSPLDLTYPTEVRSHNQLMTSAYLNLLFVLILLEKWNEVLFYSEEFEKSSYYSRESGYLVDNYKLEAYLALNQHNEILELLKKNMFAYTTLDFKNSYFSRVNKMVYPEINYKLALYINIIKMNFITNNLPEVEKGILSVLNLLNVNLSLTNGVIAHLDLPPFIFNLLLYYYVVKENYDVAINIIKRRKIPLYFVQNIFQPSHPKVTK